MGLARSLCSQSSIQYFGVFSAVPANHFKLLKNQKYSYFYELIQKYERVCALQMTFYDFRYPLFNSTLAEVPSQYFKLAVEAKLHFHINSDIMNSIALIAWVSEVLFFFFARGTCGENSRRTDTNRKPHLKSLSHPGPVLFLAYSSKAVLWFLSERPMVCEDTGTMFWQPLMHAFLVLFYVTSQKNVCGRLWFCDVGYSVTMGSCYVQFKN